MFDCVVAADLDWGIGKANALPWPKLKGDMAHFKRITSEAREGMRNAVIQGRRTWDSAEVQGRALPRRLNIIISRSKQTLPPGVLAARSLDEALDIARATDGLAASRFPTSESDGSSPSLPASTNAANTDIDLTFVIGGAQIYREAFDHASLRFIYLTRVLARFDCDVFLPNLDEMGFVTVEWPGAFEGEDSGVRYRVERLARR
ncbi:MAG: dihydrofolate reductase [Kofleriaceae bacterium]